VKTLTPEEVVPLNRYAEQRASFQTAIIEYKRNRRIAVGTKVTLLFEDRETLRYQIQEMLCVEGISDPMRVRHEVDVYNELMPKQGELSATLFVEITDAPSIRPELDRLVGIDEHVFLEIGSAQTAERIHARFDPKQFEDDRISAVQYIRFVLSDAQVRRFQDFDEPAHLHIDHPNYDHRTELQGGLRESLAQGLTGEPQPLLLRSPTEPEPPPVFETKRVHARIVGPAGQILVEPKEPAGGFLDADESLLHEVLGVVREVAREMGDAHGSCRISSAAGRGAGPLHFLLSPS